jgi:hypothetical protein
MKATSLGQAKPPVDPAAATKPGCTNCGVAGLAESLKNQRLFDGVPLGKGIGAIQTAPAAKPSADAKSAQVPSSAAASSVVPGADSAITNQLQRQLGDLRAMADRLAAPIGIAGSLTRGSSTNGKPGPSVNPIDKTLRASTKAHEQAHQKLASVIERAKAETESLGGSNSNGRKNVAPNVDGFFSTNDVRARHAAQRAAMRQHLDEPGPSTSSSASSSSAIPKSGIPPPVTPRRTVRPTAEPASTLDAAAANLREAAAGADAAASASTNLPADTAALLGRLSELQTRLKQEQQQTEKSLQAATDRTQTQFSTLADQTQVVGDVRAQLEKWDMIAGQVGDFTRQTAGIASLGHTFREHVSALSFMLDEKSNYATQTTRGPLVTMIERHRATWLRAHTSAVSMTAAKVDQTWTGTAPAKDLRSTDRGAIQFEDVLVDKDGRIWTAGTAFNQGKRMMTSALTRFSADGKTLDPAFCPHAHDATKGSIRVGTFDGDSQSLQLLLSPDGKRVYVLSTVLDTSTSPVATVSAIKTSDGQPDDSFGIAGQSGHVGLTAPDFKHGTVGVRMAIHPGTGELVVLAGAIVAAGSPALTVLTMLSPTGVIAEPFGSIFLGAAIGTDSSSEDQKSSWIGADVAWLPGPTAADDRIIVCGTSESPTSSVGFLARLRRDGRPDGTTSVPATTNIAIGALGMNLATTDGKAEADAAYAEKDLISKASNQDGTIAHLPGYMRLGAFIRSDPPVPSDAKSPFVEGPRAGRVDSNSMLRLPIGMYPFRIVRIGNDAVLVGNSFVGRRGSENVTGFAAVVPTDSTATMSNVCRFRLPDADATRLTGVSADPAGNLLFFGLVQRVASDPDTAEGYVARMPLSVLKTATSDIDGERVVLNADFYQTMTAGVWLPAASKHVVVGFLQTGRTTHSRQACLFSVASL